MSLKKKVEKAWLKVILDAALFTGQRLTSQENQTAKRTPPAVAAVWTELDHLKSSKGLPTGTVEGRIDLMIFGTALKAETAGAPDPEDVHATNVENVRTSIFKSDIADLVSAAVDDFHCFWIMPTPPGVPAKPEEDLLLDVYSFKLRVCETDCS